MVACAVTARMTVLPFNVNCPAACGAEFELRFESYARITLLRGNTWTR